MSQALTVGCKSGPSFELFTFCSLSDWKETVEESSYDVSSLSLRAISSPYELRSSNFLEDYKSYVSPNPILMYNGGG